VICGLICGFADRDSERLLDRRAPVLTAADPCIWHGCGTSRSRRSQPRRWVPSADHTRVRLAAPPPILTMLSVASTGVSDGSRHVLLSAPRGNRNLLECAGAPELRVTRWLQGLRGLPCSYESLYSPGPGASDRQRTCGVPRVQRRRLRVLIAPVLLPAAGLHVAEQWRARREQ
jgi:hypothetical protein